ncbi:response regulator transcription factor [Deferrisoma camini]|uniref:response regulator transcription factor n=1 Tax=Deferrisoma camini TaxID=1035120 RepID=UPI00046D88F2|nr:response regulator [Deferrisoma camini]NOY46179.1 response regulator [Deltaproteobacteria bacterium]
MEPKKKIKVLAVDDEPNILLSLEYILEQEGYDVHVARDGDEAIERADEIRPDVVLLDVAMPRKDGYEVCRALRQNENLASTRIVMLTAKGQPLERKKGLEVGADLYVTKPFATDELLDKIRKVLSG